MSISAFLIGLIVRSLVLGVLFRAAGKFVANLRIAYPDAFKTMGITTTITQAIAYFFMWLYMHMIYRDQNYYDGVAALAGFVFSFLGVWVAASTYTSRKTGNQVGWFAGILITGWMFVLQAVFVGFAFLATRLLHQ
jgi:hypothetical protein